jgi:hypothetical protein
MQICSQNQVINESTLHIGAVGNCPKICYNLIAIIFPFKNNDKKISKAKNLRENILAMSTINIISGPKKII